MNFNKVFIVGNLTKDPELRTTPTGQSVVQFSVATNRFWNDKSGIRQSEVEFHNIVAWGKLADIASKFLTKGKLVLVEGRIKTRTWDDQAGQKHTRVEIIAEGFQMGPNRGDGVTASGSKSDDQTSQKEELPVIDSNEDINSDDLPF